MYYKIIQNNMIIDVGFVFLKWNTTYHRLFICDPKEVQFVQSSDELTLYHCQWMKTPPAEATGYVTADVIIISKEEYDTLKEQLDIDGEIEIPDEPVPVPPSEPEPEPAQPMSAAEMRQIILQQKEQIALLTDCILEMSEVVYEGA